MSERDTLPELISIRDRLRRAKALRVLSTGKPPSHSEGLERAIFDKPTSIARSEVLASTEEREEITDNITTVREWIVKHGEYGEQDGVLSWSHESEGFSVSVDNPANTTKTAPLILLLICARDTTGDIIMDFRFDNTFKLEIMFSDDENPGKYAELYASSTKPVSEMTYEETRIIDYYLNQYLSVIHLDGVE